MSEEIKILDWDDEIESDGSGFNYITLEEGDYEFEVTKFERGQYTPKGDAKTPACNQANISIKIETKEGDCVINDFFPMASTMEWKISSFFRSIGMKKHGEKLKMDWKGSIGKKGKAHITKRAGSKEDVFFNNVKYYIDPVAKSGDDDLWS